MAEHHDHALHVLIGIGAVAAVAALLIQHAKHAPSAGSTVVTGIPGGTPPVQSPGGSGFGGEVPPLNSAGDYLTWNIGPPIPPSLIPEAGTQGQQAAMQMAALTPSPTSAASNG